MSIFDGFKEKLKKAGEPEEEENTLDDEYEYNDDENSDSDDYDSSDNDYYSDSPSSFDSYSYDYDFEDNSGSSSSNQFFGRSSEEASEKKAQQTGSNIYRMNSSSSVKINKVVFFILDDVDDARNIADCMISKDTIVLADLSQLTVGEANMVLNFLDGVRYICKSNIEKIKNIYLIVPESIELSGDFYDQVEIGSILGK